VVMINVSRILIIHDELVACPGSLLTCLLVRRLLDLVFFPEVSAVVFLKTML